MDDHVRANGSAPSRDDTLMHSDHVIHALNAIRLTVAALLGCAGAQPTYLRVSADTVAVELRWEPTVPAVTPAVRDTTGDAGGEPPAAARPGESPAFIAAPIIGVFYRASAPGAKPFVDVGDAVSPGQQVAIVEAMKMMIPVEAEQPGRIAEILCQDSVPVEYGQPLFRLEAQADAPGAGG